jgi:hypothetical protein
MAEDIKMQSLKTLLKETLLREIFRNPSRPREERPATAVDDRPRTDTRFAWAVLVVDQVSLRILQSCMQTHEITWENIACIEMLDEAKRPPTNLHAIYFLSPVSEIFFK